MSGYFYFHCRGCFCFGHWPLLLFYCLRLLLEAEVDVKVCDGHTLMQFFAHLKSCLAVRIKGGSSECEVKASINCLCTCHPLRDEMDKNTNVFMEVVSMCGFSRTGRNHYARTL